MDTILEKTKWFWPWQDDKEEAWLEEMSLNGWRLSSMRLPCFYTFEQGEPAQYAYRLDYMYMGKDKLQDYLQIFRDAGWEYLGEMSNWRYWRKPVAAGETPEIFTDNQSKIKKYQRLLYFLLLILMLLVLLGSRMYSDGLDFGEISAVIQAFYYAIVLLYASLVAIYILVVVKIWQRINQLKREAL